MNLVKYKKMKARKIMKGGGDCPASQTMTSALEKLGGNKIFCCKKSPKKNVPLKKAEKCDKKVKKY